MTASRTTTATALLALAETAKDQKKLATAIAQYLTEERRTKELDSLMREIARVRSERHTVEATATSAYPLSAKVKADVKTLIAKTHGSKTVVLNEVVDPEVIGGMRIETSEQQLDLTVQTRLNTLKKAIV